MSVVRILVDGYSLLHSWEALAPGKPRHSSAARDELVHILTQYQDASGTPVTIFFDGAGSPNQAPQNESRKGTVEVLFSGAGQTADDMIERAAHRFQSFGSVMAVTNDFAERDTVTSLGGHASSCENFIRMVEAELAELADAMKRHNRKERNRFRNAI